MRSDNIDKIHSLTFTRTDGDSDLLTLDGNPRITVRWHDGSWIGLVDGRPVIRTAWAQLSAYRAAQKIGALK